MGTERVIVVLDRRDAAALGRHESETFRGGELRFHELRGRESLAAALDRDREELETRIAKALWIDATGQGEERTDELFQSETDPVLRIHAERYRESARATLRAIEGADHE